MGAIRELRAEPPGRLYGLLEMFERAVEADRLNWAVLDFFDRCPRPCWIRSLDPQGDIKLIRVNRAFEAGMGVTAEQVLGKEPESIWPRDTVRAGLRYDRRVFETGQSCTYINEVGPVRWAVSKWPVKDAAGKVIAVCGMAEALP